MKKIAKLSLVAAVAVLGFTSANAQSLEEAIKGVETSGSVVYRYNDYNNDNETVTNKDAADNNYKVALNLSSKVNEDVKFNSRFIAGNPSVLQGSASSTNSGFAILNTSSTDDQNVNVELSTASFAYTGLQNTTINAGKQGLTTPWTVAIDSDSNEQTGTGILALSTMGPVTLAGAYFNQTNLDTSTDSYINGTGVKGLLNGAKDISTVGAIVAAGPVTLDAWYLTLTDTFDTYTVGAKSSFEVSGAKLGVDARYASLTLDDKFNVGAVNTVTGNEDKNSIAKIVLTGKAGIFDAKLAYAMTDKDGGLTALDNDAVTTLIGWNLNANGKADADYWQAVAGVDILSNLNLSANYGNIQYIAAANSTTDIEEEEIYAQLLYKMSKNLTTYARYGTYTNDTLVSGNEKYDDTRGRVQVEYTF